MVAVVGATISPIYAVGFPIYTGPLSSVYVCSAAVAAACTDSAGPGLPGAPTARVAGAPNVARHLLDSFGCQLTSESMRWKKRRPGAAGPPRTGFFHGCGTEITAPGSLVSLCTTSTARYGSVLSLQY